MSRRTQRNVGVIGLGIIGSRVAENLRQRGFHVFVWNRTPRPVPNFVGSPKEVAELCDIIQIFVSDDEALLSIVQRLTTTLKAQHLVMAHSTVAPDTMRAAAEIVERRHALFLDAPFTGSKAAAERGQLIYYIGGEEAAMQRARPVLEASSKEILEIGQIGQATMIKVATNMVTAATVQVAAEALALVHNAGLSTEKFTAAMRNNGSNSATLEMKLPQMVSGNFETNFSVKHMLKDATIASRLARSFGLEFGATDAARESLLEEAAKGRGDADYSALVRRFFPEGGPIDSFLPSEGSDKDQARLDLDLEAAPAPAERSERNGESPASAESAHSNGANEAEETEAKSDEVTATEERDEAEVISQEEVDAPSSSEEEIVVRSALPASRSAREEDSVSPQAQQSDENDDDASRDRVFSRFWRRGIDD